MGTKGGVIVPPIMQTLRVILPIAPPLRSETRFHLVEVAQRVRQPEHLVLELDIAAGKVFAPVESLVVALLCKLPCVPKVLGPLVVLVFRVVHGRLIPLRTG
jgi:hypothetical protein